VRRDPFEKLDRCHRRLEEALDALARDPSAREDVIDFLGHQMKRHDEDEERSLFPRLAGVPALADVIAKLEAQHVEQRALSERLAQGEDVTTALIDAYRTHIDIEDRVLFPAARKALRPEDLAAIAEEMEARRGGGGRRHDQR
jgi:hemerythrin-like domain-containing protein